MREHLHNLDAVLGRLANAGLRLKLEKCAFMEKEVNYLGHRIDASGLHPMVKRDGLYQTGRQGLHHCSS